MPTRGIARKVSAQLCRNVRFLGPRLHGNILEPDYDPCPDCLPPETLLRRAYRKKAVQCHPDKATGITRARQRCIDEGLGEHGGGTRRRRGGPFAHLQEEVRKSLDRSPWKLDPFFASCVEGCSRRPDGGSRPSGDHEYH